MDTLQSMRVFRQVVEVGSFAGAAERLRMSPAMTSKHVMNLEREVGARLLNRTTRHISLTEAGRIYFERARDALDDIEEAQAAVSATAKAPRGTLRITAPAWFDRRAIVGSLVEYRNRYPDVQLDINLSDRMIDIVEEGYDLALRVTVNPSPSLIARRLRTVQFVVVGSPDYLKEHGVPRVPQDLLKHQFISHTYASGGEILTVEGPNGRENIATKSVMRVNNLNMAMQAAVAGIGLVALPEIVGGTEMEAGHLQKVLEGYTLPSPSLFALYSSRRYLSPKVRTFVDFLVERMGNTMHPGASLDQPLPANPKPPETVLSI